MCEICNNRFNNCPACCVDDSEPIEAPTRMNYSQAYDILNNYIARNPESAITVMKMWLADYMVGMMEPERIIKVIKESIK